MAKGRTLNQDALTSEQMKRTLGGNLNFAAAEAYKLLRTNLDFSLPGEKKCKVMGVTSALRGEGKSTTSVNIAYTIAQSGGKVLLMEADLRLPTMAKRLRVKSRPGLSNLLAGQCNGNDALQNSGLLSNLWVMTAGDIPPNPAELLGSPNMTETVKTLGTVFDAIILDLPPVTAVSDALIVSKLVDGMLIVVKQNYCDRRSIDEVVRQLRFVDGKILGFVMTGADTQKKAYKHYGSYGDYKKST